MILFFNHYYYDIVLQSLNDGTPDVRDAAFSALAAVAKVLMPVNVSLYLYSFSLNFSIDNCCYVFLSASVGWHETSGEVVGEIR